MRAGGVIVNDIPKIQCTNPSINDHCIRFKDHELRIHLQLHRIFSFFHVHMPLVHELHECDKNFLTPDSSDWNPHCVSFENNERFMINFDGELVTSDRRLVQPQLFPPNDSKVAIFTVSLNEWEEY